jgi:Recombination, repair and ssDNA binding protein UvsY
MLTHTELMESWQKDSVIDRTELMNTLYSHPMLHSKYLTHLQTYKVQLRKHVLKYQKGKLLKQRYYNGELTKEELVQHGLSQYLFRKPLKNEMESLLDADTELQLIQEQSLYIESLVQACESILKEINSRTFLYRSIIDYVKFEAGA